MNLIKDLYKEVQASYKSWVKSRMYFSSKLYDVCVRAFSVKSYNLGGRSLYSLENKLYFKDSSVPVSQNKLIEIYESDSVFRKYIDEFLAE